MPCAILISLILCGNLLGTFKIDNFKDNRQLSEKLIALVIIAKA